MGIKGKAYIVGAYEHPTRKAPDKSLAQLHAEVAKGALEDAGLSKDEVDGYFCAGDAPGLDPQALAEYMGLNLRHVDTTEIGGQFLSGACIARRAGDLSWQMPGCTDSAGRSAALGRAGHGHTLSIHPQHTSTRSTFHSSFRSDLQPPTSTRCARSATCTSLAPRPRSWPRARSPLRTTCSATRTRRCAMSSRSKTC